MKQKILKETRGAVAIFLVLILVPMMTVSCLFVDMSRVKLSQAVIDSAGDLALNSALTQYDSLLQEYYGLFATSQSIDTVLDRMGDYFVKCIKSAGIDDTDAQLYSTGLINSVTGGSKENIMDILKIIMDKSDFSITKTPGGSICNPTLLKSQILNFMKYRAPINAGLSLLSSLKSFSNLSKETELIDKRQEYYKAEEAVNTNCKEAWNAINEYNKLQCCTDENYYTKLNTQFTNNNGQGDNTSFYKRYRKILADAYGYIYISNNKDTGDNLSFENPIGKRSVSVWSPESGQAGYSYLNWFYTKSSYNVYSNGFLPASFKGKTYSVKKQDDETIKVNTTPETDLQVAIETAYRALNDFYQKAINFNELDKDQYAKTRYVYYYVEKNREYTNAAKTFVDAMQVLEHRYRWVASSSLGMGYTTIKGTCTSNNQIDFTTSDLITKRYTSMYGDRSTRTYAEWYSYLCPYLTSTSSNSKNILNYYNFANDLENRARDAKTEYDSKLAEVDTSLEQISKEIGEYKTVLKQASDYLKTASNKLGNIADAVKSGGALSNAKTAWSNSANGLGDSSSIAAQDRAEIENIAKQFKPEDINKLKERIDNIKTNIDSILKEIDNFKFGSKSLVDIKSYHGQLRGALHGVATNNGQLFNPQSGGPNGEPQTLTSTVGDLDKQFGQVEEILRLGFKTGNISVDWVRQDNSNPYLKKQILNFYIYLYKNFNKTGDYSQISDTNNNAMKTQNTEAKDDEKKGEDKVKDLGNEKKKAAKEVTATGDNINERKNLPSKSAIENIDGSTTANSGFASESTDMNDLNSSGAASSASSTTSKLFKDIGSWLKNMGVDLRDNIYLTEYVMDMFSYNTIEKTGNSNSKKVSGKYDLQTLTCEKIDKQHNVAYGSEIEYILYGGTNAANVASAYAIIYGVRLAFNLIFAFTNSELKSTALAIATPISAATMGVVPIPLIQYGLLAAAALAESGIDVGDLKEGKKIPLYKNDESWHINLSNGVSSILKGAAGGVLKNVSDVAIDAGANKLSDLLDKSEDELKALNQEGLEGLDKQIDDAFNKVFDEQINAIVNELTSLITTSIQDSSGSKGELSVQNTTEYVKSQLKKWNESDNSTGMAKKIRTAGINYLISNDSLIDKLVKQFYDATGSLETEPLSIERVIESEVSGIKAEIHNSVRTNLDFSDYITDAKKEIKSSIDSGADKLKETVSNKLNDLGGTASGAGDTATSATASFFSFDYRNYLELFVLIAFMANPEKTLLRMADVIQVNMAKVSKKDYLLKNSSCYLTAQTTIHTKPLFLAVPFIADTANVSLDGEDGKRTFCFEYNYKKTKGY